eukprot:TRINITY_DN4839_c0_g1_i9.p1 TRINITY_DN4839_c0_g1~~TRINITY_DN4839_c0_g1_i9.p1  ORF type:complete len:180 (+),score=30.90 TRINITY_DN4839_c0_g1_i9:53-541(+)
MELGSNSNNSGLTNKQISQLSKDVRLLLESVYNKSWDSGVGEDRLEIRVGANGVQEKHSKLYYLYKPGSSITWNGHSLTLDGVDKLVQQFLDVKTKHVIRTLDVQPIVDDSHALALVTGTCRYAEETSRGYTQTLIIWKEKCNEKAKYWITHENFRWTKLDD